MSQNQNTNSQKNQKPATGSRLAAIAVFVTIAGGFALLWASENGYIDLRYWFGDCGFKQRFGLPCPGCGWTHAGQAFVSGHFIQAFVTQPAAAFFFILLSLIAIFALLFALFGINSRFLKSIFGSKSGLFLLVGAGVVVLVGWLVNIVRTSLGNG